MEENKSAFKILAGKPTGKPRSRWEENIRMDFKEISISTRNWVRDYWRLLVNSALSLRVP